jgi:hypothetical protein
MPVIDSEMMTIAPSDGQTVRSHCFNIVDLDGGSIGKSGMKGFLIRFLAHIFMPAAAGGAGTGGSKKHEGILALMAVIPTNSHTIGIAVYGNIFGVKPVNYH